MEVLPLRVHAPGWDGPYLSVVSRARLWMSFFSFACLCSSSMYSMSFFSACSAFHLFSLSWSSCSTSIWKKIIVLCELVKVTLPQFPHLQHGNSSSSFRGLGGGLTKPTGVKGTDRARHVMTTQERLAAITITTITIIFINSKASICENKRRKPIAW